jgi:mannose-1-phosphate guanylyltransferase/mannose-6-phosphate isomerase
MLQATLTRLAGLEAGPALVVCNEAHRFLVGEQLRAIGAPASSIVLEPVGRNTAPAIALAALAATRDVGADTLLLVLPADHQIDDVAAFHEAVRIALPSAAAGHLVTFGVVPRSPETGYGYIRRGPARGAAFLIAAFVEKPDAARARAFLDSGEYLWNSGMFLFRASRYIEELERHAPEIARTCRSAFDGAKQDLDFTRIDPKVFERCPSDSIDYAVMEKTNDALVVPLDAGWSDVGSWAALYEAVPRDGQGNVTRGDVVIEDTRDSYLYAESRLVAAVGLENHVVVETKDAVLVAPRDRVQDVNKLVARLKAAGRGEHVLHREVHRPWGSYDSVEAGERYQVKRLTVKPGASMSLQLHHHRAEHWIVVAGTARITRGEEVFLLEENQSTYIPIGTKHRIENPGKITLHMIEVQSGSYLGEDDIVRFEDQYGRSRTD